MTFTVKSHKGNHHYITMESTVRHGIPVYIVSVYSIPSEREPDIIGLLEREMVYPYSQKKNALAAFNRYKRKYT